MIMQGILISYTNGEIIYLYTEKKIIQNIKYCTVVVFHDKEGDDEISASVPIEVL